MTDHRPLLDEEKMTQLAPLSIQRSESSSRSEHGALASPARRMQQHASLHSHPHAAGTGAHADGHPYDYTDEANLLPPTLSRSSSFVGTVSSDIASDLAASTAAVVLHAVGANGQAAEVEAYSGVIPSPRPRVKTFSHAADYAVSEHGAGESSSASDIGIGLAAAGAVPDDAAAAAAPVDVPSAPAAPLPPFIKALLSCAFIHATTIGMQLVAKPALLLSIFDQDESRSAQLNTILIAVTGSVGFFTTLCLSALSDTYGRKPFLLFALLANSAGLLLVGCAYNQFGLWLSSLLISLFDVSNSVTYAVLGDVLPPVELTRVYNLFGAMLGAGILAGPMLAMICEQIDPTRMPFLIAGGITFLNLVYLYYKIPETLQWKERVQRSVEALANEESGEVPSGPSHASHVDIDMVEQTAARGQAQHAGAGGYNRLDDTRSRHNNSVAEEDSLESSSIQSGGVVLGVSGRAATAPLATNLLLVQPVPFLVPRPLTLRAIVSAASIHPFRNMALLNATPTLLRLSASQVLHTLSQDMMGAVVFLFTKAMWGWGTMQNAGVLVVGGLGGIVFMGWVAPRMQRHPRVGEKRMMWFSQACSIAQQVAVGLSPWSWVIYPVGLLGAAAFIWTPTLRAQISRQLSPLRQGELQGATASVNAIAAIASAAMANAIFSASSKRDSGFYYPGLVFLVAAAIHVLAILVVWGVDVSKPQPTDPLPAEKNIHSSAREHRDASGEVIMSSSEPGDIERASEQVWH